MYGLCVGRYDLNPSEYWKMSPDEVAFYVDAKTPTIYHGRLHEDDAYRIAEEIKDDDRYV